MMNMKKILIILITFVAAYQLNATPKLITNVDSNNVLIGKKINLTIEFQSEKDYNVIFPVIQDSLEKIEVLSMSEPDTSKLEKLRSIKRSYAITSFDSGSYSLGPYTLVYSEPKSEDFNVIKTNPVNVMFNTVKVDTTQPIKDIKPPMNVGWGFSDILPYLIGLLVIVALIFGYYYYKRKKAGKKVIQVASKPKIPAHEEAIAALDALKEEKLWQQGKVKEYHIRITEILRYYIERRFEINALEMITDDILSAFERRNQDSALYHKLKDVLTLGDLAKFAKFAPLPNENENSMEYTYEFVKKTIPVRTEVKTNKEDKDV